jgi:ribosomal protein S27AE
MQRNTLDDLIGSNMDNIEVETSIRNSLQIEEQKYSQEQEKILTDMEREIECPRCYDIMTLRSDFDSLFYSCDKCGFILYTIKRSYQPL